MSEEDDMPYDMIAVKNAEGEEIGSAPMIFNIDIRRKPEKQGWHPLYALGIVYSDDVMGLARVVKGPGYVSAFPISDEEAFEVIKDYRCMELLDNPNLNHLKRFI